MRCHGGGIVPLSALHWAIRVDLFTHAGQESTSLAWCARFRNGLGTVVDFEGNFVQLRNRIAADFIGRTVMVGHTFCTVLKTAADNGRLVIDFADNKDRADNPRRQALQHDGLVVIDRRPRVGIRDSIRGRRRIVCVWGRRRRDIKSTRRSVHVNNIHDKGVWMA